MGIREISVQDLAQLGDGVRLIDVREVDEFASGHVPHAVNIPLGIVPDQVTEFGGDAVYAICKSGGRSHRACEFLAGYGHDVVNVVGGTMAWSDAGFTLLPES